MIYTYKSVYTTRKTSTSKRFCAKTTRFDYCHHLEDNCYYDSITLLGKLKVYHLMETINIKHYSYSSNVSKEQAIVQRLDHRFILEML